MTLIGRDVFDHPLVILISVTALHGLNITAIFAVIVIDEDIFTVFQLQALGSPLVPPGQGYDLRTDLKGREPA